MTLLMIWKELGAERIWVVSDSRLSTPGPTSGRTRITDHAAKIFEAPLALYRLNGPTAPILSTTFGFAFTGSSLIALQAYTAVLPLWSRLLTSDTEMLPTVAECAQHLSVFVAAYANEIAASGGNPGCQCVLTGYDQDSATVDGWLIETTMGERGAAVAVRQLELATNDAMEVLGSGAPIARARLEGQRAADAAWRRQPLWMIRAYLKSDPQDDVGGGVQIGMATLEGFELYYDAHPFVAGISSAGDPIVAMKYRGFDLDKISRVGGAFASLRGLQG